MTIFLNPARPVLALSILGLLSQAAMAQTYVDADGNYRYDGSSYGRPSDLLYIGNNAPSTSPGKFTDPYSSDVFSISTGSTYGTLRPEGYYSQENVSNLAFQVGFSSPVPIGLIEIWALDGVVSAASGGNSNTLRLELDSGGTATFADFNFMIMGIDPGLLSQNITLGGRRIDFSYLPPAPDTEVRFALWANDPNTDATITGITGSGFGYSNSDLVTSRFFALDQPFIGVPEPTSIGLVGLAGFAMLLRRRR